MLTLILITGCASGGAVTDAPDRAAPTQSSPAPAVEATPTRPSYDGPTVPNSSWTKELSAAQGRRAGMGRADILHHFEQDGRLPLSLELLDGSWSISVTNDAGVREPGDVGTFEYDDQGRLVMTSYSEGCPGCVSTLAWSLRGESLSLEPVGPLPGGEPLERLIMGGTWTREG